MPIFINTNYMKFITGHQILVLGDVAIEINPSVDNSIDISRICDITIEVLPEGSTTLSPLEAEDIIDLKVHRKIIDLKV